MPTAMTMEELTETLILRAMTEEPLQIATCPGSLKLEKPSKTTTSTPLSDSPSTSPPKS